MLPLWKAHSSIKRMIIVPGKSDPFELINDTHFSVCFSKNDPKVKVIIIRQGKKNFGCLL